MATMLLSAAGAAIGGSIGGTVAGLSSVALGRLAGATLGRAIDQRILGQGGEVVESGRVERFRLSSAAEGTAIPRVFGRMRVAGQVIWATRFKESVTRRGGGKGMAPQPEVAEYSYSVSIALALCEGVISHVGRVWADGQEVSPEDLNMRVYKGSEDQMPDALMEAVEGAGKVPAYRGTAYVVMEDLPLAQFGNRVPQFSFEVSKPAQRTQTDAEWEPTHAVRGVALIPGTGEYALGTTPVHYGKGPASTAVANENTPAGITDFSSSFKALENELPNCDAVSLVVSWFGSDLRCGACEVQPKVLQDEHDGRKAPWRVAGATRAQAGAVPRQNDRPVYGGTPSDASVIEAIRHMNDAGKDVMFYPFILMEQLPGNGLPDLWSDAVDQPVLPWRGRITLDKAPGQAGTTDQTGAALAEVEAFFGSASAADFAVSDGKVTYSGPQDWRYRRFILHYAALCAAAGGVSSFCIGSEMRSLTQVRDGRTSFPAVAALRDLAAEVRAILGPDTKIGYAADWSEYFGYHPQDGTGDVLFHLDPLWSDDNIDFIGIDNYMPLSDWRDGDAHADAEWGSLYNPDYLRANVAGGEGYDWYYSSAEARDAQRRSPITDGAHGEPWVFRYKDIANWWRNDHHDRIDGVRQAGATGWVPQSKPVWFTELGCAAVDKGTNQPNKFLDPKSSESALPHYSNGQRDDFIQQQYLRAMLSYWEASENNPISEEYDGPMVDMSRAHVWAWDARPYPFFPNLSQLWDDGENYARGHWLNGRSTSRPLASVVREICDRAGVTQYDVSGLYGVVRGFVLSQTADARAALQPLMLRYGFDAVERDGQLQFRMRKHADIFDVDPEILCDTNALHGGIEYTREAEAEISGRVQLSFIQADADFEVISEEASLPGEKNVSLAITDLALSMSRAEGRQTAERWLIEERVARDGVRLCLPPSEITIGAGDVLSLPSESDSARNLYRVDRLEQGPYLIAEAVRIDPSVYQPSDLAEDLLTLKPFAAPTPVQPLFMDLPLLTGDEVPHAPYLAVTASPWPGSVGVYDSAIDSDYRLNKVVSSRATVGVTETPLRRAASGIWDMGAPLQVRLVSGALESVSPAAVLGGANLAAIGDGSPDGWEVFQFAQAELVDAQTWHLGQRLRGQGGTDAFMPDVWPAGSWFVLLSTGVEQIDLAASQRNLARHFRIGPARRGYDDPSYEHQVHAFAGNGLRPYAPCHLRAEPNGTGGVDLNWIRRTRMDGDSWDLPEVPLNEEQESYSLRVLRGGQLLREAVLNVPFWTYTSTQIAADGASGGITVQVAQNSARYGPGAWAEIALQV
ncbi:glycoside hydrolase/phage tail family protein [Shimia sp. SDUM112013]|uniref:baseplate multidomain protein megatron n=1 Tax=Shimia sp. SDUM112013 TaxID=3136160 RepID=UPI0032EDDD2D